jgi:transposase
MRKARDILRLKYEVGLGVRQIARSLGIAHGTVVNYVHRAEAAGIGWPLGDGVDEEELERLLFCSQKPAAQAPRPLPSMSYLHRELRRGKGVTLRLLWEEYRREEPQGYGYTQFCEYYRRFRRGVDPVLRQEHKAGEKLFVDWAGETIPVVDGGSGTVRQVYLFVAALGASNYIFAKAFESTKLANWIEAHIDAWEFIGGVARITVPDNDKSAVSRPCWYEPELNRSYQELCEHYGTVVIPARSGRARDKAKVESAVLESERQILARLRNRRFFSLGELNRAIRAELTSLNDRAFQKMEGSRSTWFAALDKPALGPLPGRRYELGVWRKAKANIDYHVQIDWHFYSVPYHLANRQVEVRLGARTVEIFHRGRRVAIHARDSRRGMATTDPAHRPKSHERHLNWTPGRLIDWAQHEVGEHTADVVRRILESKPHPEQGYRACLGIMRLGRGYGAGRLEAACRRALASDACTYRSIKSMLATGTDRRPLDTGDAATPRSARSLHDNIRGQDYYAASPPVEVRSGEVS